MTWHTALDEQLELSEFMRSPLGQRFSAGYFQSAYNAGEWDNVVKVANAKEAAENGAAWALRVATHVFNAEPIYVEPDMMTVVEAAVENFMPEPLVEGDLITRHGLLILPRSLTLTDASGNTITWRAALWSPMPAGIQLIIFHDVRDADYYDIEHIASVKLLPTHVTPWDFGARGPGLAVGDDGDVHPTTQVVHRQLQAILRLLVQHLAEVGPMRPPRAFSKRAARAGLPHDHVTVVRLRRPAQDRQEGEPSTVHWSHRWVVGGHWRNQWYPSLGQHRQIWISPYVKGPEELELVVNKARVFALVR